MARESAQALGEGAVALVNSSDNVIVTGGVHIGAEAPRDDVLLLAHALGKLAPRRDRRSAPRSPPPRPYPDRIDRDGPVADVAGAITRGSCVSLHGDEGVGKTYVLRAAAEHARADDGVVWIDGDGRAADDVLQGVYEELYDAHRVIADREERRSAFAGIRAIVMIDGAPADGADQIRTELADSVVVLATRGTVTWGGPATDVPLDGLAGDDAVALLARRMPDVGGQPAAARLIALLRGNPRRLVQAAALATRLRLPLGGLLAALEAGPEGELRQLLVESLEPEDRTLVELLAGACGATLAIERLQALTGIADVPARLQTLERDGIVQSASPRYRAVGVATGLERADHEHVAVGLLDSPAIDDLPAAMELLRVLPDTLVIGLGRAYAPVALYGRRWEAWNEILDRVYAASQKTHDKAATAWALHHLGTAAYVRGNAGAAEAALTDALGIREGIGDERGAAATRHNLDFIAAPPGPPPNGDKPIEPKPPGPRGWWIAAVATVAAVAIGAGVAIAGRDGDDEPEPPTPTPTVTQPPTQTPTATATTAEAEFTVTITAPEAATYLPEEVPPLDFSCTGEPEECTATVQSDQRGRPLKVDPGSSLPAERGNSYTVTAVALNAGEEVARDSVTYIVPWPDDIPPTPEATLTPTPSAPPGP